MKVKTRQCSAKQQPTDRKELKYQESLQTTKMYELSGLCFNRRTYLLLLGGGGNITVSPPPLHNCKIESHTNKPKNTTKGNKFFLFFVVVYFFKVASKSKRHYEWVTLNPPKHIASMGKAALCCGDGVFPSSTLTGNKNAKMREISTSSGNK